MKKLKKKGKLPGQNIADFPNLGFQHEKSLCKLIEEHICCLLFVLLPDTQGDIA